MEYTRAQHTKFLDLELDFQTKQYVATVRTSAIALLENDEVFSCQFVKIENGLLILKFKNDRSIPRKGEYLTAVMLNAAMGSYRNWGNITWADLRSKYQNVYSETVCTFHSNTPDQKYSIAGFRGISLEFAQKLEEKCIVILGPKEPPYKYLQNLIKIVSRDPQNSLLDRILDFDLVNHDWVPSILSDRINFSKFVLNQISLTNEIIIQGPPGTGKTHKIAEIAANLLMDGKSVLVTALTNRALIELGSKPSLKEHIKQGRVFKTNITVDEQSQMPKLINSKDIVCRPGCLCLSTFYITSGYAIDIQEVPPFDFVIMDEASQALLAMFASTKLIGKNVIWIGDPNQLPPVTIIEDDIIKRKGLIHLIEGLKTICTNLSVPSYLLSETYRLTSRGASYTGIFYNDSLKSIAPKDIRMSFSEINFEIGKFLNPQGGPTLIKTEMPVGDSKPQSAIQLVVALLAHLTKTHEKDFEIAVLTKLKKTVKELQKNVSSNLGNDRNILIETIERVQGLTCDICIFLIPNAMQNMSLQRSLFNVATSRAKRHTIIIADKNILSFPFADKQVNTYLKKLNEDFSFEVDTNYNNKLSS